MPIVEFNPVELYHGAFVLERAAGLHAEASKRVKPEDKQTELDAAAGLLKCAGLLRHVAGNLPGAPANN